MAYTFFSQKAERTKLRRLPFLPRFGITVETFGRQFTFKQVPILETLMNLRDRGFNLANFKKLVDEELDEVRFPMQKRGLAAVKDFKDKTPPRVKKASAKASVKRATTAGADAVIKSQLEDAAEDVPVSDGTPLDEIPTLP